MYIETKTFEQINKKEDELWNKLRLDHSANFIERYKEGMDQILDTHGVSREDYLSELGDRVMKKWEARK